MIGLFGMTAGEERVLSRGIAAVWAAEGIIVADDDRNSVGMALVTPITPTAVAAADVEFDDFALFGGDVGVIFALRERYVVHEYGDLVLGR